MPIVPVGFFVPDQYARPIKGHFHQRDTLGRWQFGGQCFVRIGDPWQLTASIQEKVNYRELRKTTEKMMTVSLSWFNWPRKKPGGWALLQ